MKNFIYTTLLLIMTSFFTVGCTDTIVAAAVDALEETISDDPEEQTDSSEDSLRLVKVANNFTLAWDKKDSEYNEVLYSDKDGNPREAVMTGSTAMIRSYTCIFYEDTGANVSYSCVGLGTPALGDTSAEGEVIMHFQKDIDYAFFIEGERIYNILKYSDGALSISAP